MYEKLQKVCEEILSDETKTKEFLAMSSIEEMYNFFKSKIPNLSTSEFDDFIVELLENYERMQLEGTTIDDEMLQNVSGGKRFVSKATAASLALLMGIPSGGAPALAADGTNKFSASVKNVGRKVSNTSSSYGHWLAETSPAKKFPKASAWLKKHPHVASVVSAVLILASIAGVTYGTVKLTKRYFPSTAPVVKPTLTEEQINALDTKEKIEEALAKPNLDEETKTKLQNKLRALTEEKSKGDGAGEKEEDKTEEKTPGEDETEAEDSGDNKGEEQPKEEQPKDPKDMNAEEEEEARKKKEVKGEDLYMYSGDDSDVDSDDESSEDEEKTTGDASSEETARNKAEEAARNKAEKNCKKLTTPSARVSERIRLEKVQTPSPVEKAMLDELRNTQKDDDKKLDEQVKLAVASYDTEGKRIQAIKKLKKIKKPNLLERLLLEKLENSSKTSKQSRKAVRGTGN